MENEFDTVHFEYLHGLTTIPILSRLYKLKVIDFKWKVCDKPKTHCSQSDLRIQLKLGFLSIPPFEIRLLTVGPAVINFQLNTLFNIKVLINTAMITLGPSEQMIVFRIYISPKWLGIIFYKTLTFPFAFVVRLEFLNYIFI